MEFDVEKYRRIFLTESREHIGEILRILERSGNPDAAAVQTLFREAHSLKGMSSAMGYHAMAELTHAMEGVMDGVRSGRAAFTDALRDSLFASADMLWKSVEAIEAGQYDAAIEHRLRGAIAGLDGEPSAAGLAAVQLLIEFRDDIPSSFARAYLVCKNIESLGTVMHASPAPAELRKGVFDGSLSIDLEGCDEAKLRGYLDSVKEIRRYQISGSGTTADGTAGADAGHDVNAGSLAQYIRVPVETLDYFVNVTGELLTLKTRILQQARHEVNTELVNAINQMGILLRDQQSKVMELRMLPIEGLFSRIPMWIRDLCRKLDKKVDIDIEGSDLAVDRSLVESLIEPMLHIIRNSMDHGMESPEERRLAGKAERGRITVKAHSEPEYIVVEIADDGRGMDARKILASARATGRFSDDFLDGLKDRKDIFYLVTIPGFSTRTDISDISGRGVGMDVVKSSIESFGGSLEIDSELGKGTVIRLFLPSSISIVNVLFFKLGGVIYASLANRIDRIILANREDVREIAGSDLACRFGDRHLPLRFMRDMLGMPAGDAAYPMPVIIYHDKGDVKGVAVEEIIGHNEVYLRSLGTPLSFISGFYSCTVLGDGTPVLVLDLPNLTN